MTEIETLKKQLDTFLEQGKRSSQLDNQIASKSATFDALDKKVTELEYKFAGLEKDFAAKNATLIKGLEARNADSLIRAKAVQESEEKLRTEQNVFAIEKQMVETQRMEAVEKVKSSESLRAQVKTLIEQLGKLV